MFQESKYAHVETMNYKILQRYQDKLYILFPVGGGGKKRKRERHLEEKLKRILNPVRILLRKSIL